MYAEGNTAAGMHELQTSSSLKVKYNRPHPDFIPFRSTLAAIVRQPRNFSRAIRNATIAAFRSFVWFRQLIQFESEILSAFQNVKEALIALDNYL